LAAIGLLAGTGSLSVLAAQPATPLTQEKADAAELETARNEAFSKRFSGSKLRGLFTIDGKPMTDLKDEAYEIVRATKMPKGDMWTLESRIKYGKHDLVVPVFLEVKWAGDTPVLTLDKITIPGLGTFSARVVLHEDKYAGTWQHDDVGGHLFGKIEFPAEGDSAADASTSGKTDAK
jgi:hypothetical protein